MTVSVAIDPALADPASSESALSELRSAHDEFANFFGDVFDQLQSLSHDLFARQKCLEQAAALTAPKTAEPSPDLPALDQHRGEFQRLSGAFENQLARLATVSEGLTNTLARAAREADTAQALEAARRQLAAWQEDRTRLEMELEWEHRRATQSVDALAEHRRAANEQQAALAGEMKRIRALLEVLVNDRESQTLSRLPRGAE